MVASCSPFSHSSAISGLHHGRVGIANCSASYGRRRIDERQCRCNVVSWLNLVRGLFCYFFNCRSVLWDQLHNEKLLKTLPIPNWRVVVGQLMGPCVPIALIHLITAALFSFLFPVPWPYLFCTVLALVPASLVIVANINLLGIWESFNHAHSSNETS